MSNLHEIITAYLVSAMPNPSKYTVSRKANLDPGIGDRNYCILYDNLYSMHTTSYSNWVSEQLMGLKYMTSLLNSTGIATYIMYQYIILVFCATKSGMLRLQTDLQQLFQGLSRFVTRRHVSHCRDHHGDWTPLFLVWQGHVQKTITHPFQGGIFTTFKVCFFLKTRWFLFFFNSYEGWKFYPKQITFLHLSGWNTGWFSTPKGLTVHLYGLDQTVFWAFPMGCPDLSMGRTMELGTIPWS
jgi:hypothetical protein